MKIIVLSCNKNEDTFEPFHYLMEKNYPNHPEVIYFTDGIINPYYKTIPIKMTLDKWTKGFREFLRQIDEKRVLLMIDDCFIRKPVDDSRIRFSEIVLAWSEAACLNFEKSWDESDEPTEYEGWKKRKHGSRYEVSLMCGLWDVEKLIQVCDRDCNPWTIEEEQDGKGFDYFINDGDYIIDWGYRTFKPCGKVKGVWTQEAKDFLKTQGFVIP